jgi:hypothetical protein
LEASSGNLTRDPVEDNHAITYANKIKVSLTTIFSSMNHSFGKRQSYLLHGLN